MKRKLKWLAAIMTLFFVLVACGDNDEVQDPPAGDSTSENQQETDENNTNTGMDNNAEDEPGNTESGTNDEGNTNTGNTTGDSPYNFKEFNVEADVEGTEDAVDVDYEYESDEVEASYDDQQAGINLSGDEAMQELDSIFSGFSFDQNTAVEDVYQEVLEAFNIPEDAQEVELDIEFNDGTEIDYDR